MEEAQSAAERAAELDEEMAAQGTDGNVLRKIFSVPFWAGIFASPAKAPRDEGAEAPSSAGWPVPPMGKVPSNEEAMGRVKAAEEQLRV